MIHTVPDEHSEQVSLMYQVKIYTGKYPELAMLYAIPNGGNRNVVTAKKLKAEGVKAGVPDLCLPVPRGNYHGLYIELKRTKGGSVSAEQTRWMDALRGQGYRAEVCKGAEEAWNCIKDYIMEVA